MNKIKHIPILFSTQMVKAILEGRKTMTRRIIQPQPTGNLFTSIAYDASGNKPPQAKFMAKTESEPKEESIKLKYNVEDVLWVRETFQHTKILNLRPDDENYGYVYRADSGDWMSIEEWEWKPSIFMTKEACRLFLRISNLRVERLQDISEEDAIAEGIISIDYKHITKRETESRVLYYNYAAHNLEPENAWFFNPIYSFRSLWIKINGQESWDSNPWVWVIEFEKIDKPVNF